jgi:hypothetical protein
VIALLQKIEIVVWRSRLIRSAVFGLLRLTGTFDLAKTLRARLMNKSSTRGDFRSEYLFGWLETAGPRELEYRSQLANRHFSQRTPGTQFISSVNIDADEPAISCLISLNEADGFVDGLVGQIRRQTAGSRAHYIFFLNDGSELVKQALDDLVDDPLFSGKVTILEPESGPVGLYDAWNTMLLASTEALVTNWNADDTRAPASLDHQIHLSQLIPQSDVIFSDFLVNYEYFENWEKAWAVGEPCQLRPISLASIRLAGATPHCAPVWRRNLHDQLGMFETKYKVAADREFWMRTAKAGFSFHHDPTLHVSYFLNPKGLSTSGKIATEEENDILAFQVEAPIREVNLYDLTKEIVSEWEKREL